VVSKRLLVNSLSSLNRIKRSSLVMILVVSHMKSYCMSLLLNFSMIFRVDRHATRGRKGPVGETFGRLIRLVM
jgi:hypothetical protein